MNEINWSRPQNQTYRTTVGKQKFALMRSSYDENRHIVPYEPYVYVGKHLCNKNVGVLTATGSLNNICEKCFHEFAKLMKRERCG